MIELTEGALTKIANGIDVDKPVIQILGHKKLNTTTNGDRYRLLVSDGITINSFTMLAIQLNNLISENTLSEFTVCEVTRYAISVVNRGGKEQRVMILLGVKVVAPGSEVGHRIGNPTNDTTGDTDSDKSSVATLPVSSSAPPRKAADTAAPKKTQVETSGDIVSTPISAISPYQNRWIIKARVINKGAIRTWSNSRGEGKLFSMDLVDESGEIRCTAFKAQVDKFYDMIEVGKVYYISRCSLKPANKQYNHLKNDYEMNMGHDTEVIACLDEAEDIPTIQYNFVPISEVEEKERNDLIDVLGVLKNIYPVNEIVAKTSNRTLKKRDVYIVDESNVMVCVTLWGQEAETFAGQVDTVLAVKGARVGEYNGGKSLSTLVSSLVQLDPDIPEAHRLRGWYTSGGATQDFKSLSKTSGGGLGGGEPWLTLKQATDQGMGLTEEASFYIAKAFISTVRTENALYKSCPSENCKKKVVDQDGGMYRCEKCQRSYPNFKYRLLTSMSLADWSGNRWATAFSEEAEKILGITAQELGEFQANDPDSYLERFGKVAFKEFIFKLRSKLEVYNDEKRMKTTIVSATPIDYKAYSKHLLTEIKDAMGVEAS